MRLRHSRLGEGSERQVTERALYLRRLGRRWVALHRLVYAAAVAGCLHFLWLVKADPPEPLIYTGILAALLLVRVWPRLRRAVPVR